MRVLLRRLAIAILRSELSEREAHARKLATEAYKGASGQGGRRGRAWWDGYANAVRALRDDRWAL